MLVTDEGITTPSVFVAVPVFMEARAMQPLKACDPILVTDEPRNTTDVKPLQPEKALSSIRVTVPEISTEVRLL
jgi:hypothetical protein